MAAGTLDEKMAELEERYAPESWRIEHDEASGRLTLETIGTVEVLLPRGRGTFALAPVRDDGPGEPDDAACLVFEFDEVGSATAGRIFEGGVPRWIMERR